MQAKKPFVDGIAVLHCHERGTSTLHEWSIGCDAANDNEETLRAHLTRWFPNYVLEWVDIRPCDPSTYAHLRGFLPPEESDDEFDAALAAIR